MPFSSKALRDRLRSFNFCMGRSLGSHPATMEDTNILAAAPMASSIMGFEDEVEQSLGRPCRRLNGRSKRTHELTSSIVPRGTSFHRWVELEFPPIAIDPAQLSCCRGFLPGPAEFGAVNPDAVHDHGQPSRQRNDRLLHPAVPGDLHRPRSKTRTISSSKLPAVGLEPLHTSLASRIISSPQRDMPPGRSISTPDWYRDGKSIPNAAPTAQTYLKRAGTSTVAREGQLSPTGQTPGTVIRRQHVAHIVPRDDDKQAAMQDGYLLA